MNHNHGHSHTGVERDIQLPFEELEPCCQKEILSQKREKEFKEKIRAYDRSNVRLDEHKSVFRTPQASSYSSCDCCHSSSDYHLLSSLKQKIHVNTTLIDEDSAENDSDDDFLDDDDYVSPAQQALLEQAAANTVRLQKLSTLGLGAHLSESPDHLLQLLKNSQVANVVLHIVDVAEAGSALVDIIFEELALKYPGTYFRRIPRDNVRHHPAELFQSVTSAKIVSIKDGVVVDKSNDALSRFFSHHRIDSIDEISAEMIKIAKSALEEHLSNLHILSDTAELVYRSGATDHLTAEVGEEDEEPQEAYCDVRGCGRLFPHKHISSEQESNGNKSSSLLVNESTEQGVEALDKSYFTSL